MNPDRTANCTAIPVFPVSSNEIIFPPPYALLATNKQSFTIYLPGGAVESCDLPFYNDQRGRVEKLALTPLTTTADITIVGGVLGYCILQGMAQSGASYSWRP